MYFLDTEFSERGQCVELLSIGLVSDDGREYYAQNSDASLSSCNEFVQQKVIPLFTEDAWKPLETIKDNVLEYFRADLEQGRSFDVWTYFGNYDWVALCGSVFGGMTQTPKGFPYSAFDLQQYAHHLGLRKIRVAKPQNIHNALADARWNRDAYAWLKRQELKKK
jgi:hypothetical protein